MFDKAKQFMTRKLMEHQLKKAPPEQRELIMTMMEKDPALFEKIAKEIEVEVKKGKSQQAAAMAVLPKYQKELQAILGNKIPGGGQRGPSNGFNPNGTIRK
jgi:hypothetical protein